MCCTTAPLMYAVFVAVFIVAVLFSLVSIYVRSLVLVCSVILEARRSVTRAGCHPPAPTLLCHRACSGFNVHLDAFCSWVGCWCDGGKSCAVLCGAVLLLPFVLLVCASPEVIKSGSIARKCSRVLPTNIKLVYVLGKKKCPSSYFEERHI